MPSESTFFDSVDREKSREIKAQPKAERITNARTWERKTVFI
jgi:hypothetical protein